MNHSNNNAVGLPTTNHFSGGKHNQVVHPPLVTHPHINANKSQPDPVTRSSIRELANVHLGLSADSPSDSLPDIRLRLGWLISRGSASLVHARLNKYTLPGEARSLVCTDGATDVTLRVVTNHVDSLDRACGKGLDLLVVFLQDLLGIVVGGCRRLATGPRS